MFNSRALRAVMQSSQIACHDSRTDNIRHHIAMLIISASHWQSLVHTKDICFVQIKSTLMKQQKRATDTAYTSTDSDSIFNS